MKSVWLLLSFCILFFSCQFRIYNAQDIDLPPVPPPPPGPDTSRITDLTEANYDQFITENSVVFILYYAPWCYWSKMLMAAFEQAASLLTENVVAFGRVDCIQNSKLREREGILEFPVLNLLMDQTNKIPYSLIPHGVVMFNWLNDHVNTNKEISTIAKLDTFLDTNSPSYMIAYFPPSTSSDSTVAPPSASPSPAPIPTSTPSCNVEGRENYKHVTRHFEMMLFAETSNLEVIQHLLRSNKASKNFLSSPSSFRNSSDSLLISQINENSCLLVSLLRTGDKKEDWPLEITHQFSTKFPTLPALHDYVRSVTLPHIVTFQASNIRTLLLDKRPLLVLFDKEQAPTPPASLVHQAFEELAKDPSYRLNYIFAKSAFATPLERNLLEIAAIEEENAPFPILRLLVTDNEGRLDPTGRYRLPSLPIEQRGEGGEERDIKKETNPGEVLKTFLADFSNGKLRPFYKTELPAPIPPPLSGTIITAVGSNFEDIVLDDHYDVFVFFYAPWCGHCVRMQSVYSDLAREFMNVMSVRIVKIDATKNEVRDLKISGYPTMMFFPGNSNKKQGTITEKAIVYNQEDRTVSSIKSFILQHAAIKVDEQLFGVPAAAGDVAPGVMDRLDL